MGKYAKIREFWVILILVITGLLLIGRFITGHEQNFLERVVAMVFAPSQRLAVNLEEQLTDWRYLLVDKQMLEQQITDLTAERDQLKMENQQLLEYRNEAERLQTLLGFQESNPHQTLLGARIIARSPDNWNQMITVDQGYDQGVRENMAVVSPDGLVGVVSSVTSNTARVYLLTDRDIAVGIILEESRETNGIVEGIGVSEKLRVKNVPYYSSMQVGDKVITSGFSEIYPKGIVVGTVSEVTREENGLLLSATVEPAVSFDDLEEVLIVLRYQNVEEELNQAATNPETISVEE